MEYQLYGATVKIHPSNCIVKNTLFIFLVSSKMFDLTRNVLFYFTHKLSGLLKPDQTPLDPMSKIANLVGKGRDGPSICYKIWWCKLGKLEFFSYFFKFVQGTNQILIKKIYNIKIGWVLIFLKSILLWRDWVIRRVLEI